MELTDIIVYLIFMHQGEEKILISQDMIGPLTA